MIFRLAMISSWTGRMKFMPYDKNGNWQPDPEDAIYTDPDEKKYINEHGNDTRFGLQFKDTFVPDPPNIIELKKSGQWAKMPPIHRRWTLQDSVRPSNDFREDMEEFRKQAKKIRNEKREK
jgi:hypothetical protein